jgi:flavorubredoxin
MEQFKISHNLYLFRSGGGNIPITFNQYLIMGEEPLLIHTGNSKQAVELIPMLKDILGNHTLSYIFISHFEGDECGGISQVMESFPKALPICSQITARQLASFGLEYNIMVKNPGETLETSDYKLEFIAYPSEVHLWEGLLVMEAKQRMLFSSDLFIHFDKINEIAVNSNLEDELERITEQQIPDVHLIETLKTTLLQYNIKDIAPGHGPFIKLWPTNQ